MTERDEQVVVAHFAGFVVQHYQSIKGNMALIMCFYSIQRRCVQKGSIIRRQKRD